MKSGFPVYSLSLVFTGELAFYAERDDSDGQAGKKNCVRIGTCPARIQLCNSKLANGAKCRPQKSNNQPSTRVQGKCEGQRKSVCVKESNAETRRQN